MAKFRCGVAPLQVEVGRYSGMPLEDGLCTLCNQGAIEDECHALVRCDLYNDIRSNLFSKCKGLTEHFSTMTDINKMCYILSNKNIVNDADRVCHQILVRRRNFSYTKCLTFNKSYLYFITLITQLSGFFTLELYMI